MRITGLTAHQQLDSRPALGNEMTHSENDLRPKIRDFWFLIPQEGVNFAPRNAAKCQRIGAKMPKMPRGVQNAEKCREGSRMPKALPAPNRRPKTEHSLFSFATCSRTIWALCHASSVRHFTILVPVPGHVPGYR